MTLLLASAPAKVILCGEYAVLDGAPAISMALDRRAVVTLTRGSDGRSGLESIGLAGSTDRSLFDCAVAAAGFVKTDECSFVLDTSEFSDAGSARKFGIGSSAALMVALCRALAGNKTRDSDVCEIAATAHWAFQGGTGSGVDIATSVAGGLIEFQIAGNAVTGLSWPSGLTFALLWSGVPVSSKERVDKLSKGVEKQSRKTLSVAAATAAAAWKSGDADVVMTAHGEYGDALMHFSVDHDLGIFEAGHGALSRAAIDDGVVYKPCGAGGGDIGIALATDASRLDEFVERACAMGFRHLDFGIDLAGVKLEREDE